MWGFWIPVELKFWYDYVPWIPDCTKHCNPFLRSSRRLRIPLYGWSRTWGSARLLMLMFVLPLFRVIVEPLSMAATLIWFIGVSFVELKFLPTLPPLVPASYEVPPHQCGRKYIGAISLAWDLVPTYSEFLDLLTKHFPVQWWLFGYQGPE